MFFSIIFYIINKTFKESVFHNYRENVSNKRCEKLLDKEIIIILVINNK